jgi:hypothetical protein
MNKLLPLPSVRQMPSVRLRGVIKEDLKLLLPPPGRRPSRSIAPAARDRGGVPDLSVSGDKSDLVLVDPHDPTTASETRSANAIAEPTPDGYRPCWCKISLIKKINSCAQSKNEQESKASNLNITRRWSLNYTTAARWRLFGCS